MQVAEWQSEGITVDLLDREALEQKVPGLHPKFEHGVYLPDFGQVRNPRHLRALLAACQSLGVEIVENAEQLRLSISDSACVSACTPSRSFQFDRICIAAGAWTVGILDSIGVGMPVKPVRGQMVQLKVSTLPFTRVIEQGRRYLVPRADGLILVGSTEEYVGFEKRNTSEGVSGLRKFAESIVPELSCAEMVRSWAGLRPGSPDELPYLGRVSDFKNLFVAAGHFRSGLQMSPGTGTVMADLLLDREPTVELSGFAFDRISRQQ